MRRPVRSAELSSNASLCKPCHKFKPPISLACHLASSSLDIDQFKGRALDKDDSNNFQFMPKGPRVRHPPLVSCGQRLISNALEICHISPSDSRISIVPPRYTKGLREGFEAKDSKRTIVRKSFALTHKR